ncbi:MAG: AAA family ATPase [Proteobacteria bacterium]|nr:AAA family ATPase [Pseudomonadota bacterium]
MDKYEIIETIAETKSSVIYRATLEGRPGTVIIKKLKTRFPTPVDIARFRQEYDIIKTIDLEGVIKTFEIIWDKDEIAIVMEDFNGLSIKNILGKGRIDLRLFLEIGLKVSEALGHLHKMEIIHRDIKPQNILVNLYTGQVKITDFGISTVLTRENEELYDPEVISGTLCYLSPEQTGRMNRAVDYRTDLYSLGITFYEMLVGIVPFRSKDPMEIMYSHIAIKPPPPYLFNPDVPEVVSDIIMKLVMKTPEERYQSAFGLMADFRECLKRLEEEGRVSSFDILRHDISNKFIIPPQLYGRKEEIQLLLSCFEKTSFGKKSMILVTGDPGIGKTTLINEIHKPIALRKGYFIRGKYEQLRRDVPYSAIIQAFQGLARQILSESEEKIGKWKEKLTSAFGKNGKVLTNVIPDIEFITGALDELPELDSTEARNRFNHVFEKFVGVFPDANHPLVLFLDNLQWADTASLDMIGHIITSPQIRHFFIIGAYRDNDVSELHPLSHLIENLIKDKTDIRAIKLGPIMPGDINQLIADFLKCGKEKAGDLGELIFKKTGGNPFFVNQFLKILYDKKMIWLDMEKGWLWDTEKIKALKVTDNLVELLVQKMKNLSDNTREALMVCACIGNRFDLETLSRLMGKSVDETLSSLTEAINEGLIDEVDNMYFYHHDRIQEAAYSMIPDDEKKKFHYRIGKIALKEGREKNYNDKLFYIADQLNEGSSCLSEDSEREDLIRLNLDAGKKAKTSAAYVQALNYLETGLSLLGPDCWSNAYGLTFEIFLEAIEASYLSGNFENMDRLVEISIKQTGSIIEKAKILSFKINACKAQQDFGGALRIGLNTLSLLGIVLDEKPDAKVIADVFGDVFNQIGNKTDEELISMPDMTDPVMLSAIQILADIATASFSSAPELYPLLSLTGLNIHLKHGGHPLMATAFLRYGVILTAGMGNIEEGYRFGRLAFKIIEKYNARKLLAETILVFNILIRHWKEPLKDCVKPGMEAFRIGMETGKFEMASLGLVLHDTYAFSAGKKLDEIDKDMEKHIQIIHQVKQKYVAERLALWRQYVLNLMGKSTDPVCLQGEAFDEDLSIKSGIESRDQGLVHNFFNAKFRLAYLFEDFESAFDYLEKAEENAEVSKGERGLITVIFTNYMGSLIRIALYPDVPDDTKAIFKRKIDDNQKKLLKWANIAPSNFLHRYYLVEAERARIAGHKSLAMDAYDQAISLSKKNKYLSDQALSNLLAAKFYLSTKREKIARIFMADALNCFSKWGAVGCLRFFKEKYPGLLIPEKSYPYTGSVDAISTVNLSTGTAAEALDVSTVMKVSQAISSEIVLPRLLVRMMKIVMENAGAEKGFVILSKQNKLVVEAEGTTEEADISILKSVPIHEHKGLSSSIVNYVARTKETLILKNASEKGDFTKDAYIMNNRPKSILCTPILYQGQLSGVLYLENNLSEGAFTKDRLAILNVISSQIAVSVRNANLYEDVLRWNKAAETASRAKGELLTNMTHELVNPMNAIVNLASLTLKSDIGGKARQYIVDLKSSADNLLKLITDIIELVKLETDEYIPEKNRFFVPDIIQQMVDIYNEKALQKGIELVRNVDTAIPYALIGDTRRLIKILRHLLSNAIKFTDKGTVTLGVVCIKKAKRLVTLEFSIKDTGIGIRPENFGTVFDAFTQLDKGAAKKYEGTGVGLAICKRMTELLNGDMRLESEFGKGSTFSLSLTFDRQTEAEENEYRELLKSRGAYKKEEIKSGKEKGLLTDMAEIRPILLEVKRRILQSDFNTEEYVSMVRRDLDGIGLAAEAKRLENQAGVFEFDLAMETLKEIAKKLDIVLE